MKNYKTDDSRLVYIFFDSKEKWKQRALSYQEQIISMRIKIRDLTFSRDKWKNKYIKSKIYFKEKKAKLKIKDQELLAKEQQLLAKEQQLLAKEQELIAKEQQLKEQELKTKDRENYINKKPKIVDLTIYNDQNFSEIITLKPHKYSYEVFIIQLAIQHRIISCISWRGIEQSFKLWAQFFNLPTPTFMTIRQWVLKLGLFELQQPKEKRSDWIFIIDSTWGQGQKKCFVILGLTY